jgi:hypothetical protein
LEGTVTFVTVFRRVSKPITGMIGVLYDADFERFQANLDWLETAVVLVEQFDPARLHNQVAKRRVNESVVSRGRCLSRATPSSMSVHGSEYRSAPMRNRRLLTNAEETCLVTNSLKVHPQLEATVEFEGT